MIVRELAALYWADVLARTAPIAADAMRALTGPLITVHEAAARYKGLDPPSSVPHGHADRAIVVTCDTLHYAFLHFPDAADLFCVLRDALDVALPHTVTVPELTRAAIAVHALPLLFEGTCEDDNLWNVDVWLSAMEVAPSTTTLALAHQYNYFGKPPALLLGVAVVRAVTGIFVRHAPSSAAALTAQVYVPRVCAVLRLFQWQTEVQYGDTGATEDFVTRMWTPELRLLRHFQATVNDFPSTVTLGGLLLLFLVREAQFVYRVHGGHAPAAYLAQVAQLLVKISDCLELLPTLLLLATGAVQNKSWWLLPEPHVLGFHGLLSHVMCLTGTDGRALLRLQCRRPDSRRIDDLVITIAHALQLSGNAEPVHAFTQHLHVALILTHCDDDRADDRTGDRADDGGRADDRADDDDRAEDEFMLTSPVFSSLQITAAQRRATSPIVQYLPTCALPRLVSAYLLCTDRAMQAAVIDSGLLDDAAIVTHMSLDDAITALSRSPTHVSLVEHVLGHVRRYVQVNVALPYFTSGESAIARCCAGLLASSNADVQAVALRVLAPVATAGLALSALALASVRSDSGAIAALRAHYKFQRSHLTSSSHPSAHFLSHLSSRSLYESAPTLVSISSQSPSQSTSSGSSSQSSSQSSSSGSLFELSSSSSAESSSSSAESSSAQSSSTSSSARQSSTESSTESSAQSPSPFQSLFPPPPPLP